MRTTARQGRRGFTLIEMAIVLVIIGILASVSLPFLGDLTRREKKSTADNFLKQIRDQVIGYALVNNRLPTAGAGGEFESMGLGKDPYGNIINYVVDPALTVSNVLCNTGTTTAALTVRKDPGGTTITSNDVAFVLYTIGANMQQEIQNTVANTYDYFDPRNYPSLSGVTSRAYDDSLEFATLNLLKTRVCSALGLTTPSTDSPEGADVSFAQNLADGASFVVQPAAQTAGKNAIRIDTDAGTLELGANEDGAVFACQWYQGTATGTPSASTKTYCTDGVCDWPSANGTIRAFFKFQFKNAETNTWSTSPYGDGFTFTVATKEGGTLDGYGPRTNTFSSCGNTGAYLGYGNTGTGTTRIYNPKIGIEVDTRGTYAMRDPEGYDASGTVNDVNSWYNHVAVVYWDTYLAGGADNIHIRTVSSNATTIPDQDVEGADYSPGGSTYPGVVTCDMRVTNQPVGDESAGIGTQDGREQQPSRANPSTATEPAIGTTDYLGGGGVKWDIANPIWLEDGAEHTLRIEISRSAADYATCPTYGNRSTGKGRQYTVKVWVDSGDANIANLNTVIAGEHINQTLNLVSEYLDYDQFIFGWTYGHADGVESGVFISAFGIKFAWE